MKTKRVFPLLVLFLVAAVMQAATSVAVGKTVVLTISSDGTAPLTYQWFKNGVVIAGQTASKMTITPFAATDAGIYHCVVSNSAGSVASNKEELTVFSAPTRVTLIANVL